MPGIIVGIDGSDRSRLALEWAIGEAAVRHEALTVLTVSPIVADGYWGGPVFPGDLDSTKKARESAQQETDSLLGKLDEDHRPAAVTVRAITGVPAAELVAASAGADMIVVGARGAGGFKRLLLGSVSTHVVHHARCPVVVIPTGSD